MKIKNAVLRLAVVAGLLLAGFVGFDRWRVAAAPPPTAAVVVAHVTLALLVPDDLAPGSPFIQMWQDSASEAGVHVQPVRVSEWVRSAARGARWEGVIVPDTFHRRMEDRVVVLLHDYVSGGGRLMLVYDGGLLTTSGFYSPGRSRFSDLAGVEYGMYDTPGQALARRSLGMAPSSVMKQLHIPPGRFASRTLTFASYDEPALIFDYSKQPQSFATIVTRGRPA